MFKKSNPYFILSSTSVHAGSGSDLGVIDLPIQREKHTGFPKIESSSLKGALRERLESEDDASKGLLLTKLSTSNSGIITLDDFAEAVDDAKKLIYNYDHTIQLMFGYDDDGADKTREKFGEDTEFSGALAFSDARLLLFPVKTMKGIFCWITCPYVLKRLQEDLALVSRDFKLPSVKVDQGKCLVADPKFHIINGYAILEEYAFSIAGPAFEVAEELCKFDIPEEVKNRLIILHDDDFKDFVTLSTEVVTRTKIDNVTGTVQDGALFNEEYLPAESIMYFLTFASPVFGKKGKKGVFNQLKDDGKMVLDFFDKSLPTYFQIGGNATIGKGIVRVLRPMVGKE